MTTIRREGEGVQLQVSFDAAMANKKRRPKMGKEEESVVVDGNFVEGNPHQ